MTDLLARWNDQELEYGLRARVGWCRSPQALRGGMRVSCNHCSACVGSRKQAKVGQMMAEASESGAVWFLSLTYGGTGPWTAEFYYEHVQTMLKSLREAMARRHSVSVRFFASGERGELRGRVHWHVILFFSAPVPVPFIPQGEHWEFWDWGWTNLQDISDNPLRRLRYVAKYAVKGQADDFDGHAMMSKKPPLGHVYAVRDAEARGRAGLIHDGFLEFFIPADPEFELPARVDRFPILSKYLRQAVKDAWIEGYRAAHGGRFPRDAGRFLDAELVVERL